MRLREIHYQIAIAVLILYCAIGSVWFWNRRSKFPINGRRPHIVLMGTNTAIAVACINILPYAVADLPCMFYRVLSPLLFNPCIQLMALRVFLVVFWDMITKSGIAFYSESHDLDHVLRKPSVFEKWGGLLLKYRTVLTENFWLGTFLTVSFLFFAFTFTFFLRKETDFHHIIRTTNGDYMCLQYLYYNLFINHTNLILFCTFPVFISLYILKNVQENFYLRQEFKSLLILTCYYVITIIVTLIFQKTLDEHKITLMFAAFIPSFMFITTSLYQVIYWSYSINLPEFPDIVSPDVSPGGEPSSRLRRVHSILKELAEVLNDSEGHEILFEFMKKEFAIETILFLDSCRRFKETPSVDVFQAKKIYIEFIAADAPLSINISHVSREKLHKIFRPKKKDIFKSPREMFSPRRLTISVSTGVSVVPQEIKTFDDENKISFECFDAAEKEILKLVAFGPFARLQLQPEYKEWRRKKMNMEEVLFSEN